MHDLVRFAFIGASMLSLGACTATSENTTSLGPMKYDASGTMECSAGAATYSEACGWRVLRKPDGAAEIWISNIDAPKDTVTFRVLNFTQGELTTTDGTKLQVSRDGNMWSVAVPGKEYYRFAHTVITGG